MLHYWKDPGDTGGACTGWWLSEAVGADDFRAMAPVAVDGLDGCAEWSRHGAPVELRVARLGGGAVAVESGSADAAELAGVYTRTPAAETSCCPVAYTRTGGAAAATTAKATAGADPTLPARRFTSPTKLDKKNRKTMPNRRYSSITLDKEGQVVILKDSLRNSGKGVASDATQMLVRDHKEGMPFTELYSINSELGRGNYGMVSLVKHNDTLDAYAMKHIDVTKLKIDAEISMYVHACMLVQACRDPAVVNEGTTTGVGGAKTLPRSWLGAGPGAKAGSHSVLNAHPLPSFISILDGPYSQARARARACACWV